MDRGLGIIIRLTVLCGALLAAASPVTHGQSPVPDLLPPSKAFLLEVSRPRADRLQVSWTIAEGYYLYRERLRFETAPFEVAAAFTLPSGVVKNDPFFGETEIYRHGLSFELPLEAAAGPAPVDLKVVSQGCADIGICFPPEARKVRVGVGERVIGRGKDLFAPLPDPGLEELLVPAPDDAAEPPASRLPP